MSHTASAISNNYLPEEHDLFWSDLKDVISTNSGFQRWALERGLDASAQGSTLDVLVRSYLKQTLETLAY
ncbi:MAG: hypothetical protein HC851_16695 [Acaryochloris sp. RU_4_1]|nr:hypothetical protein [Acaryochloris sp. SU_5_25]NJM67187.1 hypothetical protein [Acaryochloris sp. RU_4_1]NJN38017.1 hypothetical protein [Acaryochloridaceae cyanobacterium CSU_3_4]NJR54708.1 hypothetical protein [Acaryochloris sp. CRU_2_0]